MADSGESRADLLAQIRQQGNIFQKTQTDNVLQKASIQLLKNILKQLQKDRNSSQAKSMIREQAKQTGGTASAKAVEIQLNDKQIAKVISKLQNIKLNLNAGSSKDLEYMRTIIKNLVQQAQKGSSVAQQSLKKLANVNFSEEFSDAEKAIKKLSKSIEDSGGKVEQFKKTIGDGNIFGKYKGNIDSIVKQHKQFKQELNQGIASLKLFGNISKQTAGKIAGATAGVLSAGKVVQKIHGQVSSTIKKVIEYKNSLQTTSAKSSDMIPGGAKQLDDIRRSMNLTRQQTVKLAEGMDALRGTSYSIEDVNNAMKGLQDTLGKVDLSQIENLKQIMSTIPKQQLDALTGKSNDMEAGAAGVINLVKSGKGQAFLQAGANGAFGEQYSKAMGVQIDQNDRRYTKASQDVKTSKQTIQNFAHNATNGITQVFPYLDGITEAVQKSLGIAGAGYHILRQINRNSKTQNENVKKATKKVSESANDLKITRGKTKDISKTVNKSSRTNQNQLNVILKNVISIARNNTNNHNNIGGSGGGGGVGGLGIGGGGRRGRRGRGRGRRANLKMRRPPRGKIRPRRAGKGGILAGLATDVAYSAASSTPLAEEALAKVPGGEAISNVMNTVGMAQDGYYVSRLVSGMNAKNLRRGSIKLFGKRGGQFANKVSGKISNSRIGEIGAKIGGVGTSIGRRGASRAVTRGMIKAFGKSGGRIGANATSKILSLLPIFTRIGATFTKVGAIALKVLPAVGAAVSVGFAAYDAYKLGDKRKQAGKFFGLNGKYNKEPSWKEYATEFTKSLFNPISSMFKDEKKEFSSLMTGGTGGSVINADDGDLMMIGKAVGTVLQGAIVGALVGGPIGAVIGAIGAFAAEAMKIVQFLETPSEDIQFYNQMYTVLKQNKEIAKKQHENAIKIHQESIRFYQSVSKGIQLISKGQYSQLYQLKVQSALQQKNNSILLGLNNNNFQNLSDMSLKASQKSFAADITQLDKLKADVYKKQGISPQVRLAALNDLMNKEIQIRNRYQKQLLDSLSFENIPSIVRNNLQKKLNDAQINIENEGFFGSTQKTSYQVQRNFDMAISNFNTSIEAFSNNLGRIRSLDKENQKRSIQQHDNVFAALQGQTSDLKNSKERNFRHGEFWGNLGESALTSLDVVSSAKAVMSGNIPAYKLLTGGYNQSSVERFESNANKFKSDMQGKEEENNAELILKNFSRLKEGKTLYQQQVALQQIKEQINKLSPDIKKNSNIVQMLNQLNKIEKQIGNQYYQGNKVLSKFSKSAFGFSNGDKIGAGKNGQVDFNKNLFSESFVKKLKKEGVLTEDNKIKDVDKFRLMYNQQRKHAVVKQLVNRSLGNSDEPGARKNNWVMGIYQNTFKDSGLLKKDEKTLRDDLSDNQRKKAEQLALQANNKVQQEIGNRFLNMFSGDENFANQYKENELALKSIKDADSRSDVKPGSYNESFIKFASSSEAMLKAIQNKEGNQEQKKKVAQTIGMLQQLKSVNELIKNNNGNVSQQDLKKQRTLVEAISSNFGVLKNSLTGVDKNLLMLGSAAQMLHDAGKQQAESLIANAQNMQQLGKSFKDIRTALSQMIKAINNDANVRRKEFDAKYAASKYTVDMWNGNTKGQTAGTVFEKQIQAFRTKMDVSQRYLNKLQGSRDTFGTSEYTNKVNDTLNTFAKQATTDFKNSKITGFDYEKYTTDMTNVSKKVNDSLVARRNEAKKAFLQRKNKTKKQLNDDEKKQLAQILKGIKLDENEIASAVEDLGAMNVRAKQDVKSKFLAANGVKSQKDLSKEKQAELQKLMSNLDNVYQATSISLKGKGEVEMTMKQIKEEMFKYYAQSITAQKNMVSTMQNVRDTQLKLLTQVRQRSNFAAAELSMHNMGSAQEIAGYTRKAMDAIEQRYKQQKAINQAQIKQSQSKLVDAQKRLNQNPNDEKAKKDYQLANLRYQAAVSGSRQLDVNFFKENAAQFDRQFALFEQKIATSLKSIDIAKDYEENVAGTTARWYELQNQRLTVLGKSVQGMRTFMNTIKFANMSAKQQQDYRNKLAEAQLKLAKQRIGAQRTVFDKQLAAIVGGLQAQGAFMGLNNAAVFGIGHGINQAGMAVQRKGTQNQGYAERTINRQNRVAFRNMGTTSPLQFGNNATAMGTANGSSVTTTSQPLGSGNQSDSTDVKVPQGKEAPPQGKEAPPQGTQQPASASNEKDTKWVQSKESLKIQEQKKDDLKKQDHQIYVDILAQVRYINAGVNSLVQTNKQFMEQNTASQDKKNGTANSVNAKNQAQQANLQQLGYQSGSSNTNKPKPSLVNNNNNKSSLAEFANDAIQGVLRTLDIVSFGLVSLEDKWLCQPLLKRSMFRPFDQNANNQIKKSDQVQQADIVVNNLNSQGSGHQYYNKMLEDNYESFNKILVTFQQTMSRVTEKLEQKSDVPKINYLSGSFTNFRLPPMSASIGGQEITVKFDGLQEYINETIKNQLNELNPYQNETAAYSNI